jgi:transposase
MKKSKDKLTGTNLKSGLPIVHCCSAGADIGDTFHEIAISDGQGGFKVHKYRSFTSDLEQAVKWLKSEGITSLAMESTGVYYLPFYLLLEESGIEAYLVNARHVKNVTGRKKDDTDAIWIQRLHSFGLLQKSFQPNVSIRVLRTYVRQRKGLIRKSSDEIRRMQKALELMNIKIHTVISDLVGKTGLQIIRSILDGERDARELSKLRDPRIKASEEDIIKSLEGIWKEEYLFLLRQSYQSYFFHQDQIGECEKQIHSELIKQVAVIKEGDITEFSECVKKTRGKKNQFSFQVSLYLKELTGVDLCRIPGISEVSALEFISETGINMSFWKNSKCFSAWLNLVPNTKITGGKTISSKVMKKKNVAGQVLRIGASTLYRNKTPIGDFHRRMSVKYGGRGASLATAHKLSRIIYMMIIKKQEFEMELIYETQKKYTAKRIKQLEMQLARLKRAA